METELAAALAGMVLGAIVAWAATYGVMRRKLDYAVRSVRETSRELEQFREFKTHLWEPVYEVTDDNLGEFTLSDEDGKRMKEDFDRIRKELREKHLP